MAIAKSYFLIVLGCCTLAKAISIETQNSLIAAVLEGRCKITDGSNISFPSYKISSPHSSYPEFTLSFKEAALVITENLGQACIAHNSSQSDESMTNLANTESILKKWLWEFHENKDVLGDPLYSTIKKKRAKLWTGFKAHDLNMVMKAFKKPALFNKDRYNIRYFLQGQAMIQYQQNYLHKIALEQESAKEQSI